jgi:AcrR family transcriptional regulator
MPPISTDASSPIEERAVPRRSALAQKRSRDTRRNLVRAALQIWNERGFDEAFDDTTAEEIARAAGVSKGTFYFHFAHKEDILLEMPWATADAMMDEAAAAMREGPRTLDMLETLTSSMARRITSAPRPAVLRVTAHLTRLASSETIPESARSFGDAYVDIVEYAVERGDLPRDVDVAELGALLRAASLDAIVRWAATDQPDEVLRETLCRRADVIMCGAGVSYLRNV